MTHSAHTELIPSDQLNEAVAQYFRSLGIEQSVAPSTEDWTQTLDLAPQQISAAGTIDPGSGWTPPEPWIYDHYQNIVIFGPGTTLVTIYRDFPDPTYELVAFTNSGIWEPRHCLVRPNHRLIAVCVGGGATFRTEGNMVRKNYLAKYLS